MLLHELVAPVVTVSHILTPLDQATSFQPEAEEADVAQVLMRMNFDGAPIIGEDNLLGHVMLEELNAGSTRPVGERLHSIGPGTVLTRAIATLVAAGYIKVIVTTNFDRLTETALADVGLTPIVIATPDAAEGAPPLTHGSCFVIKVHGDYLDARIKNTAEELREYDERINGLLDRVFDEFGLIICGWSGTWDQALRAALERATARRFGTFWVRRGDLSEEAERLVALRSMAVIDAPDADTFFTDLREKVLAAEATRAPHPLSGPMAVATLKRYLQDPNRIIDLSDLVNREVDRCRSDLHQSSFSTRVRYSDQELRRRVAEYEALCDVSLSLLVTLARWGRTEHDELIVRSLQRLGERPATEDGEFWPVWRGLQKYPAALVLYGVGTAAMYRGRYDLLPDVLTEVRLRDSLGDEPRSATLELALARVFERDAAQELNPGQKLKTPASDHVHWVLREPLRDLIPSDEDYDLAFDRFEALLGLEFAHEDGGRWGPVGRFASKGRRSGTTMPPALASIVEEADAAGEEWSAFAAGLFDGDKEKFQAAVQAVDEVARQVGRG